MIKKDKSFNCYQKIMEDWNEKFRVEESFLTDIFLKSLFTVIEDSLICLNRVNLEFEGLKFDYLFTIKRSEDFLDVFKDNDGNGLVVEYKPVKIPLDKNFLLAAYEILNIEVHYNHSGEIEIINMKDAIKNYSIDMSNFKQNLIKLAQLEKEMKNVSETYRI